MAPDFSRALTVRADGILLDLEVHAGAKEDRFPDGYDLWRKRIGIRIRAPAVDGRANQAVCTLVAARLDLPKEAVTLARGPTSTRKTLQLAGVAHEALLARLHEVTA